MEIKIVGPNGEIEQIEPREMSEVEAHPIVKDSEFLVQNVASMFDLKPSEISQYGDKLDTLIRFAQTQTDDKSPEGIKWALRQLQGRVGTPPLGERWIPYLSRYAFLSLEIQKINKEKEKFERNK